MVSVYLVMLESPCVTHHPVFTVSFLTSFRYFLMYIRNYSMCVHDQFGLKREPLATIKREAAKHTLKTTRILLSSDFQPVIISLSFLACQSREATLRPLFLITLFRISATVLQSIAW